MTEPALPDVLGVEEDMESRFGAHLGAILHGATYYILRAGWTTTLVGKESNPKTRAARYMNVARDPFGLEEKPSTIVLSAGIEPCKRRNGYLIEVQISVRGPRYTKWFIADSRHPAAWSARCVFDVLHDYLQMPFLPRLLEAMDAVSVTVSPKHWSPYHPTKTRR